MDIASGTFLRGVEASGGSRVRIASGSFALGGPVDALSSVTAHGYDPQYTAVVDIFGGTFTSGLGVGGLRAEEYGTIHVYGHGLSIAQHAQELG